MLLKDYECEACGEVTEVLLTTMRVIPPYMPCPQCGGRSHGIITISDTNVYTGNQDADWLKSVGEVVDKDPSKAHCQDFLKWPTRDNYRRWMAGEGLRPMEAGEKPQKPAGADHEKITTSVLKRHQERNSLSVSTSSG